MKLSMPDSLTEALEETVLKEKPEEEDELVKAMANLLGILLQRMGKPTEVNKVKEMVPYPS